MSLSPNTPSSPTPPPSPNILTVNGPGVSLVGSLIIAAAGMAVGWLASHNIIPSADVTQDTALVATAISGAIGAAVIWYKARQSTQTKMIQSVNAADNGVKVVPATAIVAPVNVPLKGN